MNLVLQRHSATSNSEVSGLCTVVLRPQRKSNPIHSIEKSNQRCRRPPILRRADECQVALPTVFIGQVERSPYAIPRDRRFAQRWELNPWENNATVKREPKRMIRRHLICVLAALCAAAGGCSTKVNDQDAIRASIEKHLNGRTDLNLSAMDREVKQVSVNGDHASAQVEFRLKGGDARMEIEYALERQGKQWAVLSSQPMGMGEAHPGAEQSPAGAPASGSGQLPQGHPPAN